MRYVACRSCSEGKPPRLETTLRWFWALLIPTGARDKKTSVTARVREVVSDGVHVS